MSNKQFFYDTILGNPLADLALLHAYGITALALDFSTGTKADLTAQFSAQVGELKVTKHWIHAFLRKLTATSEGFTTQLDRAMYRSRETGVNRPVGQLSIEVAATTSRTRYATEVLYPANNREHWFDISREGSQVWAQELTDPYSSNATPVVPEVRHLLLCVQRNLAQVNATVINVDGYNRRRNEEEHAVAHSVLDTAERWGIPIVPVPVPSSDYQPDNLVWLKARVEEACKRAHRAHTQDNADAAEEIYKSWKHLATVYADFYKIIADTWMEDWDTRLSGRKVARVLVAAGK